jgi:hypothetical protein
VVTVHIYIEGGGDSKELHTRLRAGFSKLFERAGFQERMPRLIAGGGRGQTFDRFCTALKEADPRKRPVLLVDSEDPVEIYDFAPDSDVPWKHLARRDDWARPNGMMPDQVHLMVTCMETWIVADRTALRQVFGGCLQESALPAQNDLESRPRQDIQRSLEEATKSCGRDRMYKKGKRSFELIGQLDPVQLKKRLPHFVRLCETLKSKLSS